jgi:hypothetical protein
VRSAEQIHIARAPPAWSFQTAVTRASACRDLSAVQGFAARDMALSAPEGLKGLRDRALLLLGSLARFAGLSLWPSTSPTNQGRPQDHHPPVETDQEGHGEMIAIARCHNLPRKGRQGVAASCRHQRRSVVPPRLGASGLPIKAFARSSRPTPSGSGSRRQSMDVLQAYVRDADLFRDHAGAGLL